MRDGITVESAKVRSKHQFSVWPVAVQKPNKYTGRMFDSEIYRDWDFEYNWRKLYIGIVLNWIWYMIAPEQSNMKLLLSRVCCRTFVSVPQWHMMMIFYRLLTSYFNRSYKNKSNTTFRNYECFKMIKLYFKIEWQYFVHGPSHHYSIVYEIIYVCPVDR